MYTVLHFLLHITTSCVMMPHSVSKQQMYQYMKLPMDLPWKENDATVPAVKMAKSQSIASCVMTPHFCIQATNTSVCQAFPWSTLKGMPQSQLSKATVQQYIKFSMDLLANTLQGKKCRSANSQNG